MGLDLTLLPVHKRMVEGDGVHFAHTNIVLNRWIELTNLIIEIEEEHGVICPDDLCTFLCRNDEEYEGSHYGVTIETSDGDRLKYVPLSALLPLSTHEGVATDVENRAAWAYLAALTKEWVVILYWH